MRYQAVIRKWRRCCRPAPVLVAVWFAVAMPLASHALAQSSPDSDEVDRTQALLDDLQGDDWRLRVSAADGIGQSLSQLGWFLGDARYEVGSRDSGTQREALVVLEILGESVRSVVPALVAALDDPHWQVREESVMALRRAFRITGSLGEASESGRSGFAAPEFAESNATLAHDLRRLNDDIVARAVSDLTALLSARAGDVRTVAAKLLGELGGAAKAAAPELLRALDDPVWEVRDAAVAALLAIDRSEELNRALRNRVATDPAWQVRARAAGALAKVPGPQVPVVSALLRAAEDPSWEVRAAAAAALGEAGAGAGDAVAGLAESLQDRSWEVRQAAVQALAEIAEPSHGMTPQLLRALADPSWEVRAGAAAAIGRLSGPDDAVAAQMIAAVADPVREVRGAAVEALGTTGGGSGRVVDVLLDLLDRPEEGLAGFASQSLTRIGQPAVAALAAASMNADTGRRERRIRILGGMGRAAGSATATLIGHLSDDDTYVRSAAISALSAIGPEASEAIPQLVALLKEKDDWTNRSIGRAVARIAEADPLVPELIEKLHDPEFGIRAAAIAAIAAMEPAPILALARVLEHPEPRARLNAAAALYEFSRKSAPAVPALIRALGHDDAELRWRVAGALGRIGPSAADAVPPLIGALSDPVPKVQLFAAQALGEIRAPAVHAVPELIARLDDARPELRQVAASALGGIGPAAVSAVPALITRLDDAQPEVIGAAIHALGGIGPAAVEAVPALARLLQRAEERIRTSAANALRDIGPAAVAALPQLIEGLKDPEPETREAVTAALQALGPAGAAAAPALVENLIEYPVSWFGMSSAMALGNLGPAASPVAPQLTELLRDPIRERRAAAAQALARLGLPLDDESQRLMRLYLLEGFRERHPPPAAAAMPSQPSSGGSPATSGSHYPEFPWPPPLASATSAVPLRPLLGAAEAAVTLRQADATLRQALDQAGYVDVSYYAVPDGFAIATRIEQIREDGSPRELPGRWAVEKGPLREFSLGAFFKALFTADPGYFRVIVFVVTPHPFAQSEARVDRETATAWLTAGLNRLPEEIAGLAYSDAHETTALIYEFEVVDYEELATAVVPGRLTSRDHLQRSGVLPAMETTP